MKLLIISVRNMWLNWYCVSNAKVIGLSPVNILKKLKCALCHFG